MHEKLTFCIDAADGMHYLHSSTPPYIHRDLKPQNLLVTSNMRVKIADFGTSKLINTANETRDQSKYVTTYLAPPSYVDNLCFIEHLQHQRPD